MKILVCFGTRPEAIKMAPICRRLVDLNIDFGICNTGQHREMLNPILEFFEVAPNYELDIMRADQSLNDLGSMLLSKINEVLEKEQPEIVLVQGDTTTAMITALAAFHKRIKVGHVEAGLRTYNKSAPYPEEINRQLISRIADIHFAPTTRAGDNLLKEGIEKNLIYITGNTVVDALEWAVEKLKRALNSEILDLQDRLDPGKKLILVTGHRRESFGKGLQEICASLLELSKKKNIEIVYPVHLNPNVGGPVRDILSSQKNIHLISPVSYPTMIWLMKKAHLIISDSGGIQEEAPAFGKVVLVTRNVTEREEGIKSGFSILVGTNKEKIIFEAEKILTDPPRLKERLNPYGDGKAAARITDILLGKKQPEGRKK